MIFHLIAGLMHRCKDG